MGEREQIDGRPRVQWAPASVYECDSPCDDECRVCKAPIQAGQRCLSRYWKLGRSCVGCGWWTLLDLELDWHGAALQQLRLYVSGRKGDPVSAFMVEALRLAALVLRDGKWTRKGELLLAQALREHQISVGSVSAPAASGESSADRTPTRGGVMANPRAPSGAKSLRPAGGR